MRLSISLMLLLILLGCSTKNSPEECLTKFVTKRFAGESNKRGLLKYLSGPVYKQVNEMSSDEFETFIDFSKRKLNKLDIELKKCEENSCNVTYTISYNVKEKAGIQHKVEVKKIAKIDLFDDGWRIVNISNVKSFIEAPGINLPFK